MLFESLQKDEKKKVLNLVKDEYICMDFSNVSILQGSNYNEPMWMDVYVLLFKAKLPADINIYNILLEKLSTPTLYMRFINGEDYYLSNANEFMIRAYTNYLITKETPAYFIKSKYIPPKDYLRELLKLTKFSKCGISLEHISHNDFKVMPLDINISDINDARRVYDELLDLNDFSTNVKMDKNTILANYKDVLKLSKDKRMLATISNITNYFDCTFNMKDGNITFDGTNIEIFDEDSATSFQAKIIDAYHFFRNVINPTNKKDIISEIYNKKVSPEIKKEFEENTASYINIMKNKELIDWIITISKESDYTLKITYDEQGVFFIDGSIIVTPLDAKEYYIDYMDKKKEKLSIIIYKNNLLNKLKRIWNKFRARFAKA